MSSTMSGESRSRGARGPQLYAALGERAGNLGGLAFVIGLAAWYFGASASLDRALATGTFFVAAAAVGTLAALSALALQRRIRKAALANAAFAGVGAAFLAFNLAALANEYADRSPARVEPGRLLERYAPNKGPDMMRFEWRGRRLSIQARHTDGCAQRQTAMLEIREGALGELWLARVRCDVHE